MSLFAGASQFAFSQGPLQAVSLTAMPGMEFGLKAHNLGILCRTSAFAKNAMPGVALLQTADATREDKESVIRRAVSWLERKCKKKLGADRGLPLLLAVRSSPQKSSPGMAKSIIYVGMNEITVGTLARTASPSTAFRTRAWFLRNYARDVHLQNLKAIFTQQKPDGMSWEEYTGILLHEIFRAGLRIPDDPREQLMEAYEAVLGSMGAAGMSGAVLIQEAVVIDDAPSSGAGVYFTRSPKDGAPIGSGRMALGGDGSDVVMGDMGVELMAGSPASKKLDKLRHALERRFGNAMDVEFAMTRGALYLLQARPIAFGNPEVQVRVWQNLVKRKLIALAEYPKRVYDLQTGLPSDVHVLSDPARLGTSIGKGRSICGLYAATGRLAHTEYLATDGESFKSRIILYANDPNDPTVINAVWARRVAGVVTAGGHDYSHIAIMARALQIPMLTGVDGDIVAHIGHDVLLDEATGALYPADEATASLLREAPQTDQTRYLGIDREKIRSEVLRDIVGMSIRTIAKWHDAEIERSIYATKKGNFASALAHTWRAHYLHIELDKLNMRTKPFTVYAWEEQYLPEAVSKAIGIKFISGRRMLDYPENDHSKIRAFLAKNADILDPMFAALSQYYGDRLRIEVSFAHYIGRQFFAYEFVRVSAVVDGSDPYIFRRKISTYSPDLKLLKRKVPKDIVQAREEARALVAETPGAAYVEYDLIRDYHDRGVKNGTKVIAVLPPGYSAEHTGS